MRNNHNLQSTIKVVVSCMVIPFCVVFILGFTLFREGPLESVMTKGMTIEATNKAGMIRIVAGEGLQRTYDWNSHKKRVRLLSRTSRWLGSLGMYHPGGGKDVNLVTQEGQQHFCSEQEAIEWLKWQKYRFDWVYNSDGLVVGWYVSGSQKKEPDEYYSINVEVWQIYISGKKPSDLAGAENDKIHIEMPYKEKVSPPNISGFTPSKPQVINNRLYAGKALDFMKEQNILPKDVEETIIKGLQNKEGGDVLQPGWDYYWLHRKFSGSIIVVLDSNGRVVRVNK